MRGTDKILFERVLHIDDIEQLDKPTNAIKSVTQFNAVLKDIGEGESIIDSENNRVLIKQNGKFYKQVVVDDNIILEEV